MGILEDILKAKAQSRQQLPRFVKDPDLPFEVGDHLKADRVVYDHHGIYIGNKQVIAYLDHEGIAICSYDKFKDGAEVSVVEHHSDRRYRGIEVARRAYSRLGENNYNLIFNNCEHFANWCVTDEEKSDQVKAAVTVAGVALAGLVVAAKILRRR